VAGTADPFLRSRFAKDVVLPEKPRWQARSADDLAPGSRGIFDCGTADRDHSDVYLATNGTAGILGKAFLRTSAAAMPFCT
jgi:hypothetical protein